MHVYYISKPIMKWSQGQDAYFIERYEIYANATGPVLFFRRERAEALKATLDAAFMAQYEPLHVLYIRERVNHDEWPLVNSGNRMRDWNNAFTLVPSFRIPNMIQTTEVLGTLNLTNEQLERGLPPPYIPPPPRPKKEPNQDLNQRRIQL